MSFRKLLLQISNQRPGYKTVCGFSSIFSWKELWRFKVKVSMLFAEQNYKR